MGLLIGMVLAVIVLLVIHYPVYGAFFFAIPFGLVGFAIGAVVDQFV